ncbi:unnamed protein product [Musa banksii]
MREIRLRNGAFWIETPKLVFLLDESCALLRRHAEPMSMKLKEFQEFCRKRGLELDASSSGKLQLAIPKMREKLKNDPVLLQILLALAARTMQLAVYFCIGYLRGREDE